MPQESQLAHRVIGNLALPYITNVAPTSTDPHFVSGSKDILTSISGVAERRPGFTATLEGTPTTFHNLQRLFTWDRFDGTFFIMACDINASGFAQVYKFQVGTDASFVSIYTDTSATPFDFVVSNNTVYFANGFSAKKYDPVNGVSNWGIAIGSVNSSVSQYAGTGNAFTSPNPWLNPGNITGAPDSAFTTVALSAPSFSTAESGGLGATNYGFTIPATNSIVGVQLTLTGLQNNASSRCFLAVQLYSGGTAIGFLKFIQLPASSGTVTLGGASDTWGVALTPSIVNSSGFGIIVFAEINGSHSGTLNCTYSLDAAQLTIFEVGGPVVTVSGTVGTMTATAGYTYVFCYGNSATGHISSPTLPSNNTGTFTNKLNVSIAVVASTDPQVNQIRVFRTTDGGGGLYYELPNSPFPNTTGSVTDNAPDTSLNLSSIAPTPTFNDPPTPFQSPQYFAGRIWGFAGNKVYFSGLEEINQGVPEESFPSGLSGNYWSFDEPVQGLGVAGVGTSSILVVFCGGRVYGIAGNTLLTFQRYLISARRGTRNLTCVSSLGGMCAWLDSANQVWATDGNSLEELSTMIRPDLVSLTPSLCSMTFHTQGRFHWLVLSTGTSLYVYDIDQDQWMPPWSFPTTCLFSGETSPGNYVLMGAMNGTTALGLTTGTTDNGNTYQPVLSLSLLSVVPDYGTRFSYIGMGSYNEPTRTGYPTHFQITKNVGTAIQGIAICSDGNPSTATYTDITANVQPTSTVFNRNNDGTFQQLVYTANSPAARWIGIKVTLPNANQVDSIYELFMAYKPLGGR